MVHTPAARLAATVTTLLGDAGLLHDDGTLRAREAERRTGIARNTLARRLRKGDFNLDELDKLGGVLGLTSEEIVARANGRAA